MKLLVCVCLILLIFASSASASASPITMQVRGLADGGYVLSHTTSSGGEITYQAFCLDKNLSLPSTADFNLVRADTITRIDPVLLQRAAWISQQTSASNADKQAAVWSVMGAQVALSDRARELVSLSVASGIDLALVSVLVPTNAEHQRYLVFGIASSTPPISADVPEPTTLLLLGSGLGLIARRLRPKIS